MMLRLLLLLMAASMVSCLELPEMKNNDGAPTNFQEIGNAMVKIWGEDPNTHYFKDKFDGAEINMNEAVYLSKTFEIVGSAPKEYEALSLKIHAVLDTVDETGKPVRDFRMVYLSTARTDGNQKPFPSEISYLFSKSTTTATAASLRTSSDAHQMSGQNPPLSIHNMLSAILNCEPDPSSGWAPSCYNLRTWNTVDAAPYFMQSEPGCGGLANCQMNVSHLAYDLVTDVTDEENGSRGRTKTLIEIQISRDLPYLSRVVKFCFQGLGKYEGTPYVAKVCTEVLKFERGTPR